MKIFGVPIPFTKRASQPSAADDRLFTPNFYYGDANSNVTPQSAIQFTAVYGAVRIISESLASLPLLTYKRLPNGGKERALKHPLYQLLRIKPNNQKTTGMEFREMLTAHVLLYGNGYAQILRNRMGEPLELYPLHPTRVTPKLQNNLIIYEVKALNGTVVTLQADEVFHLRGYRDSGLVGLSPISAARKAISMGLSLESYGTNFFEGGAFPTGVLEYEGELSDQAKLNLKTTWQQNYGGENRGKGVAVTEAGLKWKPMGIPQSDAQFLEQRRFQVEEIARIFRIPPHMLADLSRSTNNNIEQQSQDFITNCMLPWFKRWEEAILRDFLDSDDSEYFSEFLVDALLRGDTVSRYQAYGSARQWGILSINEVRIKENMNPIGPDGDIYLSPLNMIPAGTEQAPPPAPAPVVQEPTKKEALPDDSIQRAKDAFREPLRETWRRIVRKEIGTVKTAAKRIGEDGFDKWAAKFLNDHDDFTMECLKPLVEGYSILRGLDAKQIFNGVFGKYSKGVVERVASWRLDPEKGYDWHEDDAAESLTRETLEYGTRA